VGGSSGAASKSGDIGTEVTTLNLGFLTAVKKFLNVTMNLLRKNIVMLRSDIQGTLQLLNGMISRNRGSGWIN
jgi:hypothetical protein